jgi:WXG100 family type VII secretion target
MSDDMILVDYGGLNTCSQQAADCAKYMNQQFDHLKTEVQTNLSEWLGQNRDAYTKLQNEWDQAASEMYQILQGVSDMVTQLNTQYQKAEQSMAQEWSTGTA